jgi:hypothetical protein
MPRGFVPTGNKPRAIIGLYSYRRQLLWLISTYGNAVNRSPDTILIRDRPVVAALVGQRQSKGRPIFDENLNGLIEPTSSHLNDIGAAEKAVTFCCLLAVH